MQTRLETVEVFMRDLEGFVAFLKISKGKFCQEYRLNKGLFANLRDDKHTPSLQTMEKCYRAMEAAGFVSCWHKHQMLIDDAEAVGLEGSIALIEAGGANPLYAATLLHEARAGNLTEVMEMAKRLADAP